MFGSKLDSGVETARGLENVAAESAAPGERLSLNLCFCASGHVTKTTARPGRRHAAVCVLVLGPRLESIYTQLSRLELRHYFISSIKSIFLKGWSRVLPLVLQRCKYGQEINGSKQFHTSLGSWRMALKSEEDFQIPSEEPLLQIQNQLFSKVELSWEQSGAAAVGPSRETEMFFFLLQRANWWLPPVDCGLWLPAHGGCSLPVFAFKCMCLSVCVCVWKLQPVLWKVKSVSLTGKHWKRLLFLNTVHTVSKKQNKMFLHLCWTLVIFFSNLLDQILLYITEFILFSFNFRIGN